MELAPESISTATDPVHGPVTIFHDVVIASEMVQPYPDGRALKHRDELEAYAWTVEGRWVKAGGHPEDAIISDRSDVNGKTMNAHFVKNLKDPKTGRPCRAGVRADIYVFDNKVAPEILDGMKNGTKRDVSIGFFYKSDRTAGSLTDGPFAGEAYDYVQRNMFHDHTAVGLEAKNGRCPSPYCGLGADEIKAKIGNDPFFSFKKFSDCEEKIRKENPGMPESEVSGICGKLEAKWKAKHKGDEEMRKELREIAQELLDAMEEIKGLKDSNADSTKKFPEWWRSIDWKEGTYSTIYDHLSPEIQKFIADAKLCPKCEEEKRKADEELPCEEKMKMGHPNWTPEQCAAECEKLEEEENTDEWDKEVDIIIRTTLGVDAQLTYKAKKGHPDEDYAYIDPDCPKKEGEPTPQSCRHLLIHDAPHVRAALAALGGARSGKPPPYADKAKPKVCAAAKKFKIESDICGKPEEKKKDEVEVKEKPLDPRKVLDRANSVFK